MTLTEQRDDLIRQHGQQLAVLLRIEGAIGILNQMIAAGETPAAPIEENPNGDSSSTIPSPR